MRSFSIGETSGRSLHSLKLGLKIKHPNKTKAHKFVRSSKKNILGDIYIKQNSFQLPAYKKRSRKKQMTTGKSRISEPKSEKENRNRKERKSKISSLGTEEMA